MAKDWVLFHLLVCWFFLDVEQDCSGIREISTFLSFMTCFRLGVLVPVSYLEEAYFKALSMLNMPKCLSLGFAFLPSKY